MPNTRDTALQPDPSKIPAIAELAALPQWVCWKYEKRRDKKTGELKSTKVPYTVTLRHAKSTDPRTWDSFDACRLVAFVEGKADGIGFVLDGSDDLIAFDLDDCVVDGRLAPWAQEIADRLRSYTEITPSGNGIRIFVRGALPANGRKKGPIEVYRSKRFLTVTGRHLAGFPTKITRRPKAVAATYRAAFGEEPQRASKPNGADSDWGPLPEPMSPQLVARELRLFPELQARAYASASDRDFALARHAWERGWPRERAMAFIRAVRLEEDDKGERADYIPRTVAAVYDDVSEYDLAVARLAKLAPHEYDQVRKAEAKALGVRVATLDFSVSASPSRKSRSNRSYAGIDEENQEESCDLPLGRAQVERSHDLSSRSVLKRVADTVEELGAAGVGREAKILYLALTTRLLPPPIIPAHVIVKGPSAGGKNYLVNMVVRLFPETAIFKMTGMSDRALAYLDEPMAHRFLILAEAAAVPEDAIAWVLIRSLLSEGEIRYPTVEKDEDGRMVSTVRHLDGPTGLIMTTTLPKIHAENETRHLTINVSDEWSQTKAVLAEQAKLAQGKEVTAIDLAPWHDYQRWLEQEDCRVVVPFAEQIVALMRNAPVRVRRDFPRFLALVMAHALLHQAKRERDQSGRLLASLADYQAVHQLAGRAFAESADLRQREAITQLVEAVKDLDDGGDAGGVTIHALIKHARGEKWGTDNRDVLTRRCREAIAAGLLVNLETKRGQLARYRVTGEIYNAALFPSSDDLARLLDLPSTSPHVEPKSMKRKEKSRVATPRPRNPA